jgi:ankyrin repeat protein
VKDEEGLVDGSTPLHIAATKGRARMVAYLLEHGANPALKDAKGRTALEAVAADDEETKKAFDRGAARGR